MPRWFNTAGPCHPAEHYMLPAMQRLPELALLVEHGTCFVVHAPRQVGKTTALLALAGQLTAAGRHLAVLVSMELGAGHRHDLAAAELAMLQSWRRAAAAQLPPELLPPALPRRRAWQPHRRRARLLGRGSQPAAGGVPR